MATLTDMLLKEVEKVNGIELPQDIKQLFSALETYDKSYWFLLNMRNINSHWFTHYDFFILRPTVDNVPENGKFYIGTVFSNSPGTSRKTIGIANLIMQDTIKSRWKEPGKKGKVFVFAWAHMSVEKDIGLFYYFDENNVNKGIYVECLNRAEDHGVFVAKNLSDLFEVGSGAIEDAVKKASGKEVYIERSKDSVHDFRTILDKTEYKILDGEIGFLMNYAGLKQTIDDIIIPFTSGLLHYDALSDVSTDKKTTKLEWRIGEKTWIIEHEMMTDYLNPTIFNQLNSILEHGSTTDKRFVAFTEPAFGQEFALSFITQQQNEKLSALKSINIY